MSDFSSVSVADRSRYCFVIISFLSARNSSQCRAIESCRGRKIWDFRNFGDHMGGEGER